MLKTLYKRKLEDLRLLLVPAIFTSKQFEVLIKRLENKQLSQTERNYLSNSIKSKITAIFKIKHLNFLQIYFKESKRKLSNFIIASYKKSGINMFGYESIKGKAIAPTEVVKNVLNNYQLLDARIVDLLPVYIFKNKGKINLFEVYDFAVENSLVNFTGYVFEIVQRHSYSNEFKHFLLALKNRKDRIYAIRDERYLELIDSIEQDDASRRWNVITLNNEKDYENYFSMYA